MTNTLANSYIATGQAVAFNRGMSPERMAERSAAYADKEAKDQALRTLQATEPTANDRTAMAEAQSVELQNVLEAQKRMLTESNKQRTFDAYERYDADPDVRHLNTMLSDLSKTGSKLYGNVARVDKFTETDRQFLEDEGFPPALVTEIINNPELNKSYVKLTQKDGTVSFGDLDVLKGLTGYNDYADAKELNRQKTAREIEQIAILGYDLTPRGREAFRRARAQVGPDVDPKSKEFQDAFTEAYDSLERSYARNSATSIAGGDYKGSEKDREARRRARIEGLEPGDEGWDESVSRHLSDVVTEFQRPSATRNIEQAEVARQSLEEEGFWETDFAAMSPRERSRWEPKVRRIEQLSGAELSATDRATLEKVQRLTSLGSNASKLTDEQTGIIDSVLAKAKRYVFNEVEGIDATSAYNAYRNLVQHALYGSALTPNEAENFTKQFGSLAQQRGPVLQQLRTTMQEIIDAYQAIARTNDPMVMLYRAGKTETELLDVIDALDERIQYIDNIAKGVNVPYAVNPPVKPKPGNISSESRAILDNIYQPQNAGGQQ